MITERESARGYGGAPQAATAGMYERKRGNDEEAERERNPGTPLAKEICALLNKKNPA